MFDKIAEILGKLNGMVLMAVALGIVVVVFAVCAVLSFGGDLGKFKKVAKKVIKDPSPNTCNSTAKQLPIRVRKQYKAMKQSGCKPDDAITPDVCVYSPFKESVAAQMPGAVMAAGILSILLSFFALTFVKDTHAVIPCVVTAGVMILRLAAGLVSTAVLKSGMKTYDKYIEALTKALGGHSSRDQSEPVQEYAQTTTYEPHEEAPARPFDASFDAPERITVELADEEPAEVEEVTAKPEFATADEPVVVSVENTEDEAAARARARAEAMAAMRAEQAAAQAAAQAAGGQQPTAAQQAAAQQARAAAQQAAERQAAAQQATAQQASAAGGTSSADEVIARIEVIKRDGAPVSTMKEVALQLQKERAKPENKTPERQRKLNEALATLLKCMSSANKK